MSEPLAVFELAGRMAAHAGQRQALVAANVANADTPGYVARQIASFTDHMEAGGNSPAATLKRTRANHVHSSDLPTRMMVAETGEPAPNGNTVSVEDQMLAAVDIGREHNRALAIYRHGLTILGYVGGKR